MMSIIIGLLMFMFLITIHEGGHFIGAKLSNIKVNEFSVGMGPSISSKYKGETKYSLRALPIGGYVSMEGEDETSSHPRSFENSSPWKRFLTVFAGPFVNFLFAYLVIFFIATFQGHTTTTVDIVSENLPAYEAGIQSGDRILSIDDKEVKVFNEVNQYIAESSGDIKVELERDDSILTLSIKPTEMENRKVIGIQPKVSNKFSENILYAWNMTFYIVRTIWMGIKGLFTGLFGLDQLSGPVGVISQVGQSISMGWTSFLMFSAIISINLGFFNLLPIPALDGSKLLFILIEMIMGKPINKKFEQNITIVGFFLLLGLIIIVSIKDVIRLF